MKKEDKEALKDTDIKWVQIHFTDLLGKLRVSHFSFHEFLNIKRDGFNFDGSSMGLTLVEKSDLVAVPDNKTFLILPHLEREARIMANIFDISLKPHFACSRYILLKAIEKLKRQGFDKMKTSPEMEFYILNECKEEYGIEKRDGYFASPSFDKAKEYRKELSEALIKSGYPIRYHHHEVGRNQHEIEIKNLDTMEAADFCIFFKYLAREIAKMHGFKITFMPKPFLDDAGSGMHLHITLLKKDKNIFYDKDDRYGLSQIARYFIGGVLEHARSIAAIANPTINSYKRLVPEFEAPCYVAWGKYNRSGLIRIPAKKEIDIEIRIADPAANPYLLYAAIIHAGIDGIKKKIEYEPIEKNIYAMDKKEMRRRGIKKLPSTLIEAIEELENDETLRDGIGKDAIELFIYKKRSEWKKYASEVTDLDYKFYFNC